MSLTDKLTIVMSGYDGGGMEKGKLFMDGQYYCEIYYNMRGWNVEKNIPVPDDDGKPVGLWISEGPLAAIRREVKKANQRWNKARIGGSHGS